MIFKFSNESYYLSLSIYIPLVEIIKRNNQKKNHFLRVSLGEELLILLCLPLGVVKIPQMLVHVRVAEELLGTEGARIQFLLRVGGHVLLE